MYTHVEEFFDRLKVIALRGVDGCECAEDPRNAEKYEHGAGTTQSGPVTDTAATYTSYSITV